MQDIKKGLTLRAKMPNGNYGTVIVGKVSDENVSYIVLNGDLKGKNTQIDQWGNYSVYVRPLHDFKHSIKMGEFSPLEQKTFDEFKEKFDHFMENPIEKKCVDVDEKRYPSNFRSMMETQKIYELYIK